MEREEERARARRDVVADETAEEPERRERGQGVQGEARGVEDPGLGREAPEDAPERERQGDVQVRVGVPPQIKDAGGAGRGEVGVPERVRQVVPGEDRVPEDPADG